MIMYFLYNKDDAKMLWIRKARHQTSYSQYEDFHPWPRLCEIHEFLNAQQIMQGR